MYLGFFYLICSLSKNYPIGLYRVKLKRINVENYPFHDSIDSTLKLDWFSKQPQYAESFIIVSPSFIVFIFNMDNKL